MGAGLVLNVYSKEMSKLPVPVFYDSTPDKPLPYTGLIGSGGENVYIAVRQTDMVSRFFGEHPLKTPVVGSRHRRMTRNVYDFYSMVYEIADDRIFNC